MDLTSAKSELSKYQNHHLCSHMNDHASNNHGVLISPVADAATHQHHHNHHEMGMMNIIGGHGGGDEQHRDAVSAGSDDRRTSIDPS
ncbi:hypothetical protein L6452_00845 [Arctium lappa]|uniref:Uncharacterized protein n=1 Tax=Arctium lappa TaxID=4217 RepID=A0ACB9FF93_ARCLA|nr:hypothetical protein L6452_00845 [Arctium lappa]